MAAQLERALSEVEGGGMV